MARIPTAENLGTVSISSARAPATISGAQAADIGASARALGDVGEAIGRFGAQMGEREKQAKDYETTKRFIDFDLAQDKALEDLKQSAPPDAQGFTQGFRQNYDDAAREFFSEVPDDLKPKFDELLVRRGAQFEKQAFGWENKTRDAYHETDVTERLVNIQSEAALNPNSYQENIARGITLIDASPMSAAAKNRLRRTFARDTEELTVKARIERGDDLDSILNDLLGSGASEPLDTDENPELRAKPKFTAKDVSPARVSVRMETGQDDPLKGVSQIARDAGGTKSYGNFGLNSQRGGSIFDFKAQYGERFGLTAKPSTPAFDKQWRKAASEMPEELHAAEMEWYSANVLSEIGTRLTKAGVPGEMASDPRVVAYFADRSIQQGTGSIDEMNKHKRRIGQALEESGDDPVEFLKAMTELDRDALRNDFPTALRTGVYGPTGHNRRVDGRLEMALETVEADNDNAPQGYDGPYRHLPMAKRLTLANQARIASRAIVQQAVDDSVEQIKRTGEFPVDENGDSALDRAARIQTRNQFEKSRIKWDTAQIEFEALNGLETLTDAELNERLYTSEPQVDQDLYAERAKVYDRLSRSVEKIRDIREKDPASAVSSLPDVQVAEQGVRENPGDPQFVQALVKARMDAQAEVMPDSEGLWSPITKQESRVILAPTRGLEGDALYKSLEEAQAKFEEQYGPYARVAAAKAFEYDGRSKETAEELAGFVDGLFKGEKISASQIRRLEFLNETDLATRAFGGDFVGDPVRQYQGRPEGPETGMPMQVDPANAYRMRKPPKAAIDALQANPELRDQFDAHYGAGSSDRVLVQ